ncbi:energy-coupling factor transporter transmembrane component T family protein [Cohnella cholangitidis]|uniref:Energy-coupling factor transporter transmembrane protein EcfT n=1 Tax=Cohnella cholangitidis TaxID=2598458 RepID=A0A7G5BXY3_9BACL|nr:energy-coupling factor transporter transmembrane component T [Cohnella cholangitidis]QMV41817.1 energy-coupling factor transporter transmembrane protein EcfT [Cohnella cholangitidis]
MSLIERWMSRFTLEQLKMTLLRTAYGNKNTFLSRIDPRVLLIWYAFFTISPWFFYDRTVLVALFAVSLTLALTSRVSGLILFLMAFSTFMNLVYIGVLALFLGGNGEAFLALITLTLKLLIMGLASVAVFTSIDPEKLSDALLAMKVPAPFSFGISYGYRMIPILVEQYQDVFASYRMRGAPPTRKGWLSWRIGYYFCKICVLAFYPTLLNTAKRVRTTVEALEMRGFTYTLVSGDARRLKLSRMSVRPIDGLFCLLTIFYIAAAVWASKIYSL